MHNIDTVISKLLRYTNWLCMRIRLIALQWMTKCRTDGMYRQHQIKRDERTWRTWEMTLWKLSIFAIAILPYSICHVTTLSYSRCFGTFSHSSQIYLHLALSSQFLRYDLRWWIVWLIKLFDGIYWPRSWSHWLFVLPPKQWPISTWLLSYTLYLRTLLSTSHSFLQLQTQQQQLRRIPRWRYSLKIQLHFIGKFS